MPRTLRSGWPLALMVFVAILALAASPAGAGAPQRQVLNQSGSFLVEDCGGGVVLTETFTETDILTVFLDADGNPIRGDFHANFNGVITNSGSGNTYRDPAHFSEVFDLVNGGVAIHGMNFLIVVKGVGIVVHETGTLIRDANLNVVFEAGPHQVTDGTAPDLCSVLI